MLQEPTKQHKLLPEKADVSGIEGGWCLTSMSLTNQDVKQHDIRHIVSLKDEANDYKVLAPV